MLHYVIRGGANVVLLQTKININYMADGPILGVEAPFAPCGLPYRNCGNRYYKEQKFDSTSIRCYGRLRMSPTRGMEIIQRHFWTTHL